MDFNRLCKGCFRELPATGVICPYCGFDEAEYERGRKPEVLPLNSILRGAYIVGKCLGKGGFGITYIGWHINLETVVAIKEFFPAGIVSRNTNNPDPQASASVTLTDFSFDQAYRKAMQSFMSEARILGKLHMPGVVGVHDCFEENNTVYLVMDYISGCDLKKYIKQNGGKVSEEETLKLMHPVIGSLHELHQQNVIHRDISPDNILLNEKGEAILVDFGAARTITAQAAEEHGARSLTVVLKPGYAPMEQYNIHGNQGPWTDVYALCATMYRMLTGRTPDDPGTRANNDNDEQTIRQNLKENRVSAHMIDVLVKGLQLRVKDRYQSIQELGAAFYSAGQKMPLVSDRQSNVPVKSSESPEKTVTAVKSSKRGKSGNKKWIAFISIAALVIIAACIGIASIRKQNESNSQSELQPGERPDYVALDYVELGKYKGLTVEGYPIIVTEEEIDTYVQLILKDVAETLTTGVIEYGDIANINYVGKINGEEFEGGAADEYDLEIGSGTFIPGFEEALVGTAIGETKDIDVTFPEDYPTENLAGKEAVFTVTVNFITRVPDASDEVISDATGGEFTTLESFRENQKREIEGWKQEEQERFIEEDLMDQLYNTCTVKEFPDGLLEYNEYQLTESYSFFVNMGYTIDEETIKSEAQRRVRQEMILLAIAEKEELDVTDEEYDAYCEQHAEDNAMSVEDFKADHPERDVIYALQLEKAKDFVRNNAVINIE